MLTLSFERDKETKNTVRFSEMPDGRERGIVGMLYLHKSQDNEFGQPTTLTVTISADPAESS